MGFTSVPPVKCEVRLTHEHYYAGDAVEGALTMVVASTFPLYNIHLKIVGKEEVHALVDEVAESKTSHLQFGISTQDYVYYREIVTLAGPLLTQGKRKRQNTGEDSRRSRAVQIGDRSDDDANHEHEAEGRSNTEDDDGDADEGSATLPYNESMCVRPDLRSPMRSFALSQIAVMEGVTVSSPAGRYVYPFRFLLPPSLPPSYDSGILVKRGEYSNSRAALHYYVKAYVWAPNHVEIAAARADFYVGASQPPNLSDGHLDVQRLAGDGDVDRERARMMRDGATHSGTCDYSRSVSCVFPILGGFFCRSSGRKLRALFTLQNNVVQVGRDGVCVRCGVPENTSSKPLRGIKVSLIQTMCFETAEARVTTNRTILEEDILGTIAPGKSGSIAGCTTIVSTGEHRVPTLKTSGVEVRYSVRVALLGSNIDYAVHIFEDVLLTGEVRPGTVPPEGPMRFTALPRGRLTRREAFYAVPTHPSEAPQLPVLDAPVLHKGAVAASRRVSQLLFHGSAEQ